MATTETLPRVEATKALAALRGQIREHVLGPLLALDGVLEVATRIEGDLANLTDRKRGLADEMLAARAELQSVRETISQQQADAEAALARTREDALVRLRREHEQTFAELLARRQTFLEESRQLEGRIGELRKQAADAKQVLTKQLEEGTVALQAAEATWTVRREGLEREERELKTRTAELRAEHRAVVEQVEALLARRR